MIIVSTHTPKLSESIPLVMRPALARGSYWRRAVTADAAADDASGNLRISVGKKRNCYASPTLSQNCSSSRRRVLPTNSTYRVTARAERSDGHRAYSVSGK
jgi:hypothetical protein